MSSGVEVIRVSPLAASPVGNESRLQSHGAGSAIVIDHTPRSYDHDDDDDDESIQGGDRSVTDSIEDLYLRDSGADEEDDLPAPGRQSRTWSIDHSFGDQFIDKTNATEFDGAEAINILQRPFTMDYGSRKAGSKPASEKDTYHPMFYLDFMSVVGCPLQSISRRSERFFDNVTISLQYWGSPYSAKRGYTMPFDLTNRTFRLATGSSREIWFLVMHPTETEPTRDPRHNTSQGGRSTALAKHHAEALASYIKSVFLSGELLGEGIEPAWKLGGSSSQTITYNKWAAFQDIFMEGWVDFVEQQSHQPFWAKHNPGFVTHDHGANIEIEVNEQIQSLEREVRLRMDDGDEDEDEDTQDDRYQLNDLEEDQYSINDEERSQSPSLFVQDQDRDQERQGTAGTRSPMSAIQPDRDRGTSSSQPEALEGLYSPGLRNLRAELEQKYNLDHLQAVSYALAVNLHCTTLDLTNQGIGEAVCLLADRNCLAREYATYRDYTFCPLAFNSAYGNFFSPKPPAFLENGLFAVMRDNMSFLNEGADVLSCDHFQAYSSGTKDPIRKRPTDLLASQGIATAALTVPVSEVDTMGRVKVKRLRHLDRLRGRLTPDNPAASTPFARERQRIEAAMGEEEFAFRLEQVFTMHVPRLTRARRNFQSVLQPIFQFMRFFLKEKQSYSWILRRFPPKVFPGVLTAFAKTFELAIGEMERRFTAAGERGLGLALSEAVAALDRLGNFCFTGDPRVLPSKVFRPLGTMDSLRKAGWPYIDPSMLDFRNADGVINIGRWPMLADERPVLMHVAALAYHYGPVVAANRHSQLWFAELGGQSIQGISSANRFLEKLFRELWIPQMKKFVGHQLHRRLNQGLRSGRGEPANLAGNALRVWEECDDPFTWNQLIGLPKALILAGKDGPSSVAKLPTKARQDWAEEMFNALAKPDLMTSAGFAPTHSTWFSVLKAAIQHTSLQVVTKAQWVEGLATAMHTCGIEWVPGRYRQRLSHCHIIRLVGSVTASEVLAARPGSLKRLALEAALHHQQQTMEGHLSKRTRRRKIDFGCDVPFKAVPQQIQDGFRKLHQLFSKDGCNHKVLEHYQKARNSLQANLGHPLCDLMLMLALTISASSVTPQVAPKDRIFSAAPKKKESTLLAANMVTRMLWFFKPTDFPWGDQDDGSILRISEMTKKMEHKGVSNRVLRELGWIKVEKNRDSPRNSESTLSPPEELYALRRELLSLRKDPEGFIGRVFSSDERIWVERCSSIVREF